jgi:hypothetical protein
MLSPSEAFLLGCRNDVTVDYHRRGWCMEDRIDAQDPHWPAALLV